MKEVPIWEKANLTIIEAAEYSDIGINRLEALLKKQNCSFVLYVGKKKLVKRFVREDFHRLLLSLFMVHFNMVSGLFLLSVYSRIRNEPSASLLAFGNCVRGI